jgi:hypothetical protein
VGSEKTLRMGFIINWIRLRRANRCAGFEVGASANYLLQL